MTVIRGWSESFVYGRIRMICERALYDGPWLYELIKKSKTLVILGVTGLMLFSWQYICHFCWHEQLLCPVAILNFVRFGLIFSGTLPDSSNACGYQGCVDHAGKTRIPVASSRQIFLMTFVSRRNGRNIYVKCWLQFIKKKHQLQKLLILVSRRHTFQFVCWSDRQISQLLVYQRCHIQLCIF